MFSVSQSSLWQLWRSVGGGRVGGELWCAVEWKSYSLPTELYQVSTWDTRQVQPKIMEILTCRVLFYGLVQT